MLNAALADEGIYKGWKRTRVRERELKEYWNFQAPISENNLMQITNITNGSGLQPKIFIQDLISQRMESFPRKERFRKTERKSSLFQNAGS